MKKSDLKPGMVIQYRDGDLGIIVKVLNTLYILDFNNHMDVFYLEEDLTAKLSNNCTIDKVFKIKEPQNLKALLNINNQSKYLTLIWERPKQVEYSIEELESKLGLKSGTLRIKK